MKGDQQHHRCLLLLPESPQETSLNNLRVAYGPAVLRILHELAQISSNGIEVMLDIAIRKSIANLDYASTQAFLGRMYTLMCMLLAEQSIDLEYGNEIDFQLIIVLAEERAGHLLEEIVTQRFTKLARLAVPGVSWTTLYSCESESGEELLQSFLGIRKVLSSCSEHLPTICRVPGGLVMKSEPWSSAQGQSQSAATSWGQHDSIAVGGTFDHLHAGHKLLLTITALVLKPPGLSNSDNRRYLTIGITGDDLLKSKQYVELVEGWDTRQKAVQRFLLDFLSFLSEDNKLKTTTVQPQSQSKGREVHNELSSGINIRYVELFDPFGPTIADPEIDALVLSGETRNGGKAVNAKRAEAQWSPLEIFEVDVLEAHDKCAITDERQFESKISSTNIRSKIHRKIAVADTKT